MISVVLPSNRCDIWLEDAIDSILNSICKEEIQIIVVLNNLNNEQSKNIPSFQAKYGARVELLDLGNGTLVDALNYGVERSKFEFIARLDSDDTMSNLRLQKQFDFLYENTDVALVGSSVNLIDEFSEVIGQKIYPLCDSDIKACLRFGNCFAHPSVMFRKSIFNSVGRYSNEFLYSEDFDLFVRISREHRIENMKEKLTNYRVFEDQISSRFVQIQEFNSLEILKRENSLRSNESRIGFFLERKLLKARYGRARNTHLKTLPLLIWIALGILFNSKNTLSYLRQFSLNTKISSNV